jgi:hypothetical protein
MLKGSKVDLSLIGEFEAPSCFHDFRKPENSLNLVKEKGWNIKFPNQVGVYDKSLTFERLCELFPIPDVARALWASIVSFRKIPTQHSFPDGCVGSTSYVLDQDIYTFRVLLCDPLDERGCFYYRGQGYAPNVALAFYHAGKWYSLKI